MRKSLEKLNLLWKHGTTRKRTKPLIYEHVVQSKIMYALSGANLTDGMLKQLDAFQRRGLRQILKIDTTWAQIKNNISLHNRSEYIYNLATIHRHPGIREILGLEEVEEENIVTHTCKE